MLAKGVLGSHWLLLLNYFFLKLIVACRLCVIYVREDNDYNV